MVGLKTLGVSRDPVGHRYQFFFQGSQIKVKKSQKVLASSFKRLLRKLEKNRRMGNFAPPHLD